MRFSKHCPLRLVPGLLLASLMTAQSQDSKAVAEYSDQAELASIQRMSAEVPHLNLGKLVQSAAEANMVGVRSERVTFSRRLDSRTFFAQNQGFGITREAGVFGGSDEELQKLAASVMSSLKIPAPEMGRVMVLQEKSQVAQVDPQTGKMRAEKEELGNRQVRIARSVEGIPVFSSHGVLSFTKGGDIGFMEVHWPEIPDYVVAEAHRLQYKVKNGWKAPPQKDAEVESIEAGIVHSPAVGFLMDVYPAIRVIYAPTDKRFGQKPAIYFDREGHMLPPVRQFYSEPEPTCEHRPERTTKEGPRK